ncbi:hypothetical protein Back11_07070 [Paenibacillus baekrokdamisoli]|uniref:Copper amine oxidase-like N-terminal domain-containing protein n=1 Tax=Paenibacillus baekrokdamisoli TaxID=1712516 RepID=A0A3G9IMA9_9BACL|nr:hypothetical protein [Paenibacillus baekrokdamisoli]MBB3067451.1 hypothetical protein [Paenibacillus baekrokdamisoli]BBH19362.1 hypothetical protein Back11_07070 [Paenibacillus baekrokdamisoli]
MSSALTVVLRSKLLTLLSLLSLMYIPISTAQAEGNVQRSTSFIKVEAGEFYSVGLREDGSVWTWGRNLYSELGLQEQMSVGAITAPVRLLGLDHIQVIATNNNGYQLAVKADGTVWEWGRATDSVKHGILPRQIPGLTGIVSVAAGSSIGIALREDGSVLEWARNQDSQVIAINPIIVPGLKDVTKLVIANGETAYAITQDGKVWYWNAATTDGKLKLTKPTMIKGLPPMVQVATSHGIDRKGQAWSWELGYSLQSDLKTTQLTVTKQPKKFHPELKLKEIRGGLNYSLLLTEKGDIYSYGFQFAGKEGKVSGISKVTTIAAGSYHNLAIDSLGRVWGWGADKWFETGNNPGTPEGMVYRPALMRDAITMKVNGEPLKSMFPAMMREDHTILTPLKDVARAFGGDVTVAVVDGYYAYTLQLEDKEITFHINDPEPYILINGNRVSITKDMISGTSGAILVTSSFWRLLGFHLTWDSAACELNIALDI